MHMDQRCSLQERPHLWKLEVSGDAVIDHGKGHAVKEKRSDIFERKWKYILEPLEELNAGRILSIQAGATRDALSRREDD